MSGVPSAAPLVIGSRASRLARIQARWVGDRLCALCPELRVEYRTLSTAGDRDAGRPLPEIGGKGVFTAELDGALADGSIDLAVHSLKDLPVEEEGGTVIAAIPVREDPRDVLVTRPGLRVEPPFSGLPRGASVGTSSLRRAALVRARFPDADVRPLRGNVETRLGRLSAGGLDAVVLAAAGLRRLGLWPDGTTALPPAEWLPAPGQGALAVQARGRDTRAVELAGRLDDAAVRAAVTAERSLLAALGAGCHAPVGALAEIVSGRLGLRGAVYDPEGTEAPREGREEGSPEDARALGERLAVRLLDGAAGLPTSPRTA